MKSISNHKLNKIYKGKIENTHSTCILTEKGTEIHTGDFFYFLCVES